MRLVSHVVVVAALGGAVLHCASLGLGGGAADEPVPMLEARIVRISEEYANINTDVNQSELADFGILHGQSFRVRFEDRELTVLLGTSYSDVPRGGWVGLIEEDDRLQIAIGFGHAATELACSVDDVLFIERLDSD
jgi:S-adenosylmethionine hydrolase